MTFDEILAQVTVLLQRQGRVSYRALKLRFGLDEDYMAGLKDELIDAQRLACDEEGKVLVWAGDPVAAPAQASAPARAQERPPLAYLPPYLTDKILASRRALEGERKQVTVLFADLKDSTELIRDLDPEAAQQLLDPALQRMMDAVPRFEGTVNQVLGDGIMALFGAPIAHEDHALRACYAALAMQAAMQPYSEEVRRTHGLELRLRVGLNSGEVVVRAIGNDLHMDYSAVGQTTHLAARMEQLATPGSIRLTAATHRLVEGLVRVQALGLIPIKGLADPVDVYELVGATAMRRRLQAAVARGLTRFVGRETETAALTQALERAAAGHGQVVAVVGEAGVGKSRLLYEFSHSHRTQGWLVLESASVSYGKATPYFPVLDLLKRYCHVEEPDDTRTIRAKVTGQVLTLDETLQETLPALLSLLDALPEDSPFLRLEPPQRRQRTLDACKRVLLRETQVQPLLLVFEDLHWIDAETQALLDSLVESLPTARLLLLVNYRPEYQHGWGSKTYYTQVRLDPLPPASADAFLQALLGDDPSLAPLTRLLIARTEGNYYLPAVASRTWMAWCLAELGAFADGLARGEEGLRIAETVDHPASRITAYAGMGNLSLRKGDVRQAISLLERGLNLCQEWQIAVWSPAIAASLGAAYALAGRLAEALPLLEQAVAQGPAIGVIAYHAFWLVSLGEGYLLADRLEDASTCAERALQHVRAHKQRGGEAYALRLLGDIAAHRDPPAAGQAETHYQQALALAEELDMRPLQAHCHRGLGTLYGRMGRVAQARTALTTAVALYRAMDMMFWLPQAEAALVQVRG